MFAFVIVAEYFIFFYIIVIVPVEESVVLCDLTEQVGILDGQFLPLLVNNTI